MKPISFMHACVIGVALSFPVATAYANTDYAAIEKLVSELANKPEHHKALADYYRTKAEETKKSRDLHEKMKNSYGSFNPKSGGSSTAMSTHCEKIISAETAAIQEYEAMAKEHDTAAADFLKSLPQ